MPEQRQADGRQRTSGRVTPSKLRRNTVIALDGVLALGAGALGGLFATGAASAAAPTPGWTGAQAPLPAGPDAPASNPTAILDDTSCTSAVFCAAAGYYTGAGSVQHPLLEVKSGGTWSALEAPYPSNADTADGASLTAVSCASQGSCVATGHFTDSLGRSHGLIETLSGGTWSPLDAPAPGDAQMGSGYGVSLSSVDCQTALSCVVVGEYKGTGGGTFGLIDTYAGGHWSSQPAPQPSDAPTHQEVLLESVSCPSVGPCAAGGFYFNGDDVEQGLLLSQAANGTWSGEAAPSPAGSDGGTNAESEISGLSCAATTCEGVGYVRNAAGNFNALLEQLSGGTWTASMAPEPANAGSGSNQDAGLLGVSCTFDGICNAVGFYEDQANGVDHALIVNVNGSSTSATEGPQPADAASGANIHAELNSISCVSGEDCSAVGFYSNNSNTGNNVALIDSSTGGSWANTVAPLPQNAGTGGNAFSYLTTVDCTSRGPCESVGDFEDTAANQFGVALSYTPPEGYYSVASDGGIFNYGSANFHGSRGGQAINAPMVGMAATPGNGGYWEVGSDGGIFSYGDAVFHGSTGSLKLNAPIVGMAATPDGGGYWLVATDGGIFNYGDAGFYGSTGSIHLNKPIVGMAATPDGHGYWLVASDGGIFNYGDAGFYGSRGGQPLNKPIVGMAADASGLGYWLVASDGGIFNYGDASFLGSRGGQPLNKPIVTMMSTFDGAGYWLTASDGGIFSYGDTGFYGSAGSIRLNAPVVSGTPS